MDKQQQIEQENKLKKAVKNAPEKVRKAINEKVKGLNKPFNK
ncbi:hypothetical protein [Mucilaginibacter xinganensis]|uniref:Uncharacterized protein n=1 Tax=Mucilaginibacter xinganensis TaxID=1234841 RepID=A0A223NX54_9SPHI|nr:hypothetical protein [Mucilaginibacter xinganensis]ASU34406.1 hypothetical protein MuYL_2519 [Mucilaginibacter xinganensis]